MPIQGGRFRQLCAYKPTIHKLVEMIRRGNGFRDLASKQAVERAIMAGRGNVDLLLTPEQYARLVR
jgi:hypothetical protein